MTNIKQICAQLIELWDADCDINTEINELRTALAESESQRRCLYSPVQIAECGGPCEQGPEHCDCGELCVTEPEPEGPTLDEIDDLCAEHSFCYEDSESLECLLLIITDALARWGK